MKLSFTGVVSITLNFHPQGRNVNDVTENLKSLKPDTTDSSLLCLEGTGVVSVTLNFHPQGRNVNDVTNEGKS